MPRGFLGGRASARPLLFPLLAGLLAVPAPPPAAFRPAGAAPRAVLRDATFDFGSVRKGEAIVHAFRLHNAGTSRLAFTGATLSMPGMRCRVPPPVEPGADGTVSVEWDTGRVQGRLRGVAAIATNDPATPSLELVVTGRVIGPFEIAPMPAIFLSTFRGEGARRELSLRSNEPGPVSLRLAAQKAPHVRASLDAVEEGRAWRLAAAADPGAEPGRYEEELSIESGDPAIGRIRIPVHLFVKADLYANPDDLDFGELSAARLQARPGARGLVGQTFFVKKRSGKFRIVALRSSVPALVLRADPASGAAASFQIDAGLRPGALTPGELDGTIAIETDDAAFPVVTVRVRGKLTE